MPLVHRLANTGTLQTTTYFDEFVDTTSGSLLFNNSNYLSTPSTAAYGFGTGDFTLECWVYFTSTPTSTGFISGYSSPSAGVYLRLDSGTSLTLGYGDTGIKNVLWTPSVNTWHHVAATRKLSNCDLFINGIKQGSSVSNSTDFGTTSPSTVYIGRLRNDLWPMAGYISNVRVVKGTAVYTSNFVPLKTSLTNVLNTSILLNTKPSAPFADSSVNNLTFTNNGSVVPSTVSPFAKTPSFTANNIIGQLDEVSNVRGSIFFNGPISGTNRINVPASNTFNFGTGDFTVECWSFVPLGTTQVYNQIITLSTDDGGIAASRVNNIYTAYGLPGGSISSGVISNDGQWHHLALVRSGTTVTFYVDGISRGSLTDSGVYDWGSTTGFRIGSWNGNSNNFIGNLSNIRLVKGTAVYTSNFTPPRQALTNISNTSILLNAFNSQPYVDSSNNNFTVTLNQTGVNTISSNTLTAPISTTQSSSKLLSPSLRLANTGIITVNGQFDETTKLIPPPAIGDPYGGGYFAGQISLTSDGVATHNLVVADRTVGQAYGKKWGVVGVETGVTSIIDGPGNSTTLSALGVDYEAATFCKAVTAGGYTDWYMPANNELNQLYYYFKPYDWNNNTGYGANAYAVSPQPINTNYTASNPPITPLTNFQNGASSQEFSLAYYWASTEETPGTAKHQFFFSGDGAGNYKDLTNHYVRAVRRVPV